MQGVGYSTPAENLFYQEHMGGGKFTIALKKHLRNKSTGNLPSYNLLYLR